LSSDPGHVFIATSGRKEGFYPREKVSEPQAILEWYNHGTRPGKARNDILHPYDASRTKQYRACVSTVAVLLSKMTAHKNDTYGFSNKNARNCAGWALERLREAGFTTMEPTTEHLKPSQL
jgi:hypothetical protein